ncbi:MAG: lysophospholipase [Candidatus Obscuribacterales bacterium]|nr:lysophospholipase [Candidatus Obscuribacterales bacterium]
MNFPQDHEIGEAGAAKLSMTGIDGSKQYLRYWQAEQPSAMILYLHGIEGHSLWFADTARFMKAKNVAVLALDRRGSGLSEDLRGDAPSWQILMADVRSAIELAGTLNPGVPLFLMANCWGAKLGALIAGKDEPTVSKLAGLILSSPAIEVKVDLDLKTKLNLIWHLISFNKSPFVIPLSVEDFTDNPKYLEFIKNDELRLTEATAQFFFQSFLLGLFCKLYAEKIEIPTLLLQSGNDSIVDESGVDAWFRRISSKDKLLKVFSGCKHSLDFDQNPQEYRKLLLSWILKHAHAEGAL